MSIGETLAHARREAGLSIAEISSRTRLRLNVIYDIEHDDYSTSGGDRRVRENIAAIARALSVDSGPLIESYDAAGRPAGWITATGPSEPVQEMQEPESFTPWQEPEAFTPAQEPEPVTAPQEPEPFTPPQQPEPVTAPQEPQPLAPPQQPEPITADGDTQPIAIGRPSEPITTGEPVRPLTFGESPFPITPAETAIPPKPFWPVPPAPSWRVPSRPFWLVRWSLADRRSSMWIALGGALIAIALLGGILLIVGASGQATPHTVVAGQHRGDGRSAPHPGQKAPPPGHSPRPPRPTPQTSPAHGRPAQALVPASIKAFGPGGAGHGDSPELAHQALAGKAAAPWHSAWYTTPHFGNLQAGTGLLLDMGRPVTITSARIALGNSRGADIALRIGNSPSLARLRPVAHANGVGGVVRLKSAPARGRYVLVWFTRLPPDQTGAFQVSVYDVKLRGYQR